MAVNGFAGLPERALARPRDAVASVLDLPSRGRAGDRELAVGRPHLPSMPECSRIGESIEQRASAGPRNERGKPH